MNHKVIHEFRVTEGRPAGLLEGEPLMLAHFMGAKSGVERVAPLVPLLEKGRIFAGKGGADPQWGEYQRSTECLIPVVALVRARSDENLAK
jgi:hypothetical protein